MRLGPILLVVGGVLFLAFVLLVPVWRLPPDGTQLGPNSASMVQFEPTAAEAAEQNRPPAALPVVADDPRPATAAFKNVKVLTDVNAGDFMRLQNAMTAWVAPQQGCGFCHAGTDYASDAKPAKQAARVMLAMTRHINTAWKSHVGGPSGADGVTCFSCHRGQPVPSEVWFQSPPNPGRPMIDKQEDYEERAITVRTFFPNEGYEEYLLQATPGLAQSYTALPSKETSSQIEVKRLYEMMMQMSDGVGVNCGYCHESRAFYDWRQSTPARWTGYSGMTLTRDINRNFILKLAQIMPEDRGRVGDARTRLSLPARDTGPQIGNGLADCATCHHGSPKPLAKLNLIRGFPALAGPDPAPAAPNSSHP